MKKLLMIVALFAFIGSSVSASVALIDDNSQVITLQADNDKDPDKDKDKDKKKKDKKKAKKDCPPSCKTKCAKTGTKCSTVEKKSCCPSHAKKTVKKQIKNKS